MFYCETKTAAISKLVERFAKKYELDDCLDELTEHCESKFDEFLFENLKSVINKELESEALGYFKRYVLMVDTAVHTEVVLPVAFDKSDTKELDDICKICSDELLKLNVKPYNFYDFKKFIDESRKYIIVSKKSTKSFGSLDYIIEKVD